MNNSIKLSRKEINRVRPFIQAAFPNYKGFKVSLRFTDHPITCASYWDEGCKDDFVLLHSSGARKTLPTQSFYDVSRGNHPVWTPVADELLVEHSRHGQTESITLHFHTSQAPKFIPAAQSA